MFKPDRHILWIDVKGVFPDSKAKYVPFINSSGFALTIRNFTTEDLGIKYSCTYGFKEGKPKVLTEELAMKG